MASLLQVVGVLLVVAGLGWAWPPLGVVSLGAVAVLVGMAVEVER